MRATTALAKKDLRVTLRSPLFALISIFVPVAFTLLYAIVIHVSTTSTIAVADEDRSLASAQFVKGMAEMHNDDGHYYEILTTDPARAHSMYRAGEVGALLVIPAGFEDRLTHDRAPRVQLELVNINADGTKNQHIRLEAAVRQFNLSQAEHSSARLAIREQGVLMHDIPITIYLGSALLVFAALYAGIVNAGVAVAREWEERTAKALVLSPAGPSALVAGKWISSLVTSAITLAVAVAGIAWVLGLPVQNLGLTPMLTLAAVWLYGAALGTLLGVALKKSLPLIPIAVIVAVGHFLVCGYESYIRGFAHGGIVEPLWQATHWIPLSRLFDAVRYEVAHLPQPEGLASAMIVSLLAALALAALASRRLSRTMTFSQGQ